MGVWSVSVSLLDTDVPCLCTAWQGQYTSYCVPHNPSPKVLTWLESRQLSVHTFYSLRAGWAKKPPAVFVMWIVTLDGSGFQILLRFQSKITGVLWADGGRLLSRHYPIVGCHTLKIEVPDSHFLVACVSKDNVMLSIKVSKYMYCCHYCGRGLRYFLQRKSVLLLSKVNGSAFAPRCTVIMAQCTDFLSSDPVFC